MKLLHDEKLPVEHLPPKSRFQLVRVVGDPCKPIRVMQVVEVNDWERRTRERREEYGISDMVITSIKVNGKEI